MPLIKGKSKKSFVKNLKTEMEEGKPQKQSLAIAYAMKRKAEDKKMADGGEVKGVHKTYFENPKLPANKEKREKLGYEKSDLGESRAGMYAKQRHQEDPEYKHHNKQMTENAVEEHHKVLGELKSMPNPKLKGLAHGGEMKSCKNCGYAEGGPVLPGAPDAQQSMRKAFKYADGGEVEPDMVDMIMKKKSYSEGGKVANECDEYADEQPNEFDDMVLRDDLKSTYGDDDNSGDSLGNKQEDMDRSDIIAKIMTSRKKKDRMPNPA